jgi:hypothetical protein
LPCRSSPWSNPPWGGPGALGRKVALSGSPGIERAFPYLTLQDHRVCDSLEENKYYTPSASVPPTTSIFPALEALQGNPLLFRSDAPRRGWRSWRREPAPGDYPHGRGVRLRSFPGSPRRTPGASSRKAASARLCAPDSTHLDLAQLSAGRGRFFRRGRFPASRGAFTASASLWKSAPTWRAGDPGGDLFREIPVRWCSSFPSPPGFRWKLFVRPLGLDGPALQGRQRRCHRLRLREEARAWRSAPSPTRRAGPALPGICPPSDGGAARAGSVALRRSREDCLEFLLELEEQGRTG